MGRQIQLSMLPNDADAILTTIRNRGPIEVLIRDADSADVAPLTSVPDRSDSILILWNKHLTPTLKRKWISARTPGYYSVDYFTLPVLEFSLSVLTEWKGKPALTQGRIYGQFDGKPIEFEKWFEQIVRYIRKIGARILYRWAVMSALRRANGSLLAACSCPPSIRP